MLEHMPLRQRVRDLLLERIAQGELKPGERVVESKLARELQISTVPIREALLELTSMRILESEPFKGARVREVSLAETIEAFEVRAALESLAARQATSALQDRCTQLHHTVKQIVKAARQKDFAAFQEHNQVFHRAIVNGAGNGVLLKTWESLAFQIRTRFAMDYLQHEDPVAIAKEHEAIVKAIEQGKRQQVSDLLSSHSQGLVKKLQQEYQAHRRQKNKTA